VPEINFEFVERTVVIVIVVVDGKFVRRRSADGSERREIDGNRRARAAVPLPETLRGRAEERSRHRVSIRSGGIRRSSRRDSSEPTNLAKCNPPRNPGVALIRDGVIQR
jgi:hypothetical protein